MSGKSEILIYLSGSIKKGSEDNRSDDSFWTPSDEQTIASIVTHPVRLLNPAKSPIRRNDYFANFGCDLFLIDVCHFVLVDLRMEKGIGVGAEMMYARKLNKPVISWLPSNSYYKRDFVPDVFGEDLNQWIHPFAFGLSDKICETLEDACKTINELINVGIFAKQDQLSPDAAIRHFTATHSAFAKELRRDATN